jgi:hypothetical protein
MVSRGSTASGWAGARGGRFRTAVPEGGGGCRSLLGGAELATSATFARGHTAHRSGHRPTRSAHMVARAAVSPPLPSYTPHRERGRAVTPDLPLSTTEDVASSASCIAVAACQYVEYRIRCSTLLRVGSFPPASSGPNAVLGQGRQHAGERACVLYLCMTCERAWGQDLTSSLSLPPPAFCGAGFDGEEHPSPGVVGRSRCVLRSWACLGVQQRPGWAACESLGARAAQVIQPVAKSGSV